MKRLLIEIPGFLIAFFITYVFCSYMFNGFVFKNEFITDSIPVGIGATIGWGIIRYIQIRKKKKK